MAQKQTIEIDTEVFEYLQGQAAPFVDSPNDVLRRLLLKEKPLRKEDSRRPNVESNRTAPNVGEFVSAVLRQEFGTDLRRKGRYRLMFENDETIVYVQNFNKSSSHLWYRITEKPWRELCATEKAAWICFTNPPDSFAYVIPVSDIKDHVESSKWARDYLEVNIDPMSSRWIELEWKIYAYRKSIARDA